MHTHTFVCQVRLIGRRLGISELLPPRLEETPVEVVFHMIQEPEMARQLGVDLLEIQASLMPPVPASRRANQTNTNTASMNSASGLGADKKKGLKGVEDVDDDKRDADSKFWTVTSRDDVLLHAVSLFMYVCMCACV
jgi:hypothetical protein